MPPLAFFLRELCVKVHVTRSSTWEVWIYFLFSLLAFYLSAQFGSHYSHNGLVFTRLFNLKCNFILAPFVAASMVKGARNTSLNKHRADKYCIFCLFYSGACSHCNLYPGRSKSFILIFRIVIWQEEVIYSVSSIWVKWEIGVILPHSRTRATLKPFVPQFQKRMSTGNYLRNYTRVSILCITGQNVWNVLVDSVSCVGGSMVSFWRRKEMLTQVCVILLVAWTRKRAWKSKRTGSSVGTVTFSCAQWKMFAPFLSSAPAVSSFVCGPRKVVALLHVRYSEMCEAALEMCRHQQQRSFSVALCWSWAKGAFSVNVVVATSSFAFWIQMHCFPPFTYVPWNRHL